MLETTSGATTARACYRDATTEVPRGARGESAGDRRPPVWDYCDCDDEDAYYS